MISDLDEWRRVCLKAFENLRTDTELRMADVDRVLAAGARRYAALPQGCDQRQVQLGNLLDDVAATTGVEALDVDAILCWAGVDAAALMVGAGHGWLMAHLIIRQHLALTDEGIGPKPGQDYDAEVLRWAVKSAGGDFDEHELWDCGLVADEVHAPRCRRGYPHDEMP